MPNPGARGGWDPPGPETISLMTDLRQQPDLRQQLHLGAAKAHRSVVYSHYEYRNINRSSKANTGKVGSNG